MEGSVQKTRQTRKKRRNSTSSATTILSPTPKRRRKLQKPPPIVLLEVDVVERWTKVREEKNFSKDEDVARFLLSW
jgi:hypothetical protein